MIKYAIFQGVVGFLIPIKQTSHNKAHDQKYGKLFSRVQSTQLERQFKISTANRFMIKPGSGVLKIQEEIEIEVVIHKDIVKSYESQKVQIIYGKNLQDAKNCKTANFSLLIDGIQSDLNLTMMVQSKVNRVKSLQGQIMQMKQSTIGQRPQKTKSSKMGIKLLVVIILGLLLGFYGPIKIFKKKSD